MSRRGVQRIMDEEARNGEHLPTIDGFDEENDLSPEGQARRSVWRIVARKLSWMPVITANLYIFVSAIVGIVHAIQMRSEEEREKEEEKGSEHTHKHRKRAHISKSEWIGMGTGIDTVVFMACKAIDVLAEHMASKPGWTTEKEHIFMTIYTIGLLMLFGYGGAQVISVIVLAFRAMLQGSNLKMTTWDKLSLGGMIGNLLISITSILPNLVGESKKSNGFLMTKLLQSQQPQPQTGQQGPFHEL